MTYTLTALELTACVIGSAIVGMVLGYWIGRMEK